MLVAFEDPYGDVGAANGVEVVLWRIWIKVKPRWRLLDIGFILVSGFIWLVDKVNPNPIVIRFATYV